MARKTSDSLKNKARNLREVAVRDMFLDVINSMANTIDLGFPSGAPHNHDDRYYTEAETNLLFHTAAYVDSNFADIDHDHVWSEISNLSSYTGFDMRYYRISEINNFFSGAASISGYNKSNWDAAFEWDNHALAGYYPSSSISGTSNKIALFGASSNLGNSILTQSTRQIQLDGNANAITSFIVSNSDNTNGSTRSQLVAAAGTVDARFIAIATFGLFMGASSNHRVSIMMNGSEYIGINATNGRIQTNQAVDSGESFIIGGSARVNGLIRINGDATGNGSFLQFNNASTAIGFLGSRGSIDGGSAAEFGLYVYNNNPLSFWTNGIRRAEISGSGVTSFAGLVKFNEGAGVVFDDASASGMYYSGSSIFAYNNVGDWRIYVNAGFEALRIASAGNSTFFGNIIQSGGIYHDLRNTAYLRFSNTGGGTRWGYIQHDGSLLAYAADVGYHYFTSTGNSPIAFRGSVFSNKIGYLYSDDNLIGLTDTLNAGVALGGVFFNSTTKQTLFFNNGSVSLLLKGTGAATFESISNSDWGMTVYNNGTTNAHGLYVNIGESSTGIPFRVDKNGTSLLNIANSGQVNIWKSVVAGDHIYAGLRVVAGTAHGFFNANYQSGFNNIWAFETAQGFGIAYKQGATGWYGGDTIRIDVSGALASIGGAADFEVGDNIAWVNGNMVWHVGNDGPGSGLNADLLDGHHASHFYPASNPNGYINFAPTYGVAYGMVSFRGSGIASLTTSMSDVAAANSGGGAMSDFTLDAGGLKYTGSDTIVVAIECAATLIDSTLGSGNFIHLAVGVGGTTIADSEQQMWCTTEPFSVTCVCIVSIAPGQLITLQAASNSGSGNVELRFLTITAHKVD